MALPPLELFSLEEEATLLPGGLFLSRKSPIHRMFLLLAVPILASLYALPLLFRWVPPNPVYGFRNPRTRQDRALWFAANQRAAAAILIAMAVCVALGLLVPGLRYSPGGHIVAVVIQISGLIIANAWTAFWLVMRSSRRR